MTVLCPIHQHTILQRREHLFNTTSRWACWRTKDKLRTKGPTLGKLPLLNGVFADSVVLQAASEAFGGQGGPDDVLVHSLCVVVPYGCWKFYELDVYTKLGHGLDDLQSGYWTNRSWSPCGSFLPAAVSSKNITYACHEKSALGCETLNTRLLTVP